MKRLLAIPLATLLASQAHAAGIAAPFNIASASAAAGSTTLAMTTTAACPAGSLIEIFASQIANGNPVSVADSAGNTYTGLVTTQLTGSVAKQRFLVAGGRANAGLANGGTITVTYSGTIGVKLEVADCILGTAIIGTALDANPTGNVGSSTSPTISTSTLISPAEIVFCGYTLTTGSGVSFTPTSGFTALTAVSNVAAIQWEYEIVSASTAVTCAPTLGTTQVWGADANSFIQTQTNQMLQGVGQ